MLSWGEEFSDDGCFGKLNPLDPSVEEDGIWVPISFLDSIVDPKYIREISIKDKARIDFLTSQLSTVGQLQSAVMIYDRNSIRLKDGNHRYLAAKALGWSRLRVKMRRVDAFVAYGMPLDQALPRLLEIAFLD